MMAGCTGNNSTNLSDIPETMVSTHADSIVLAHQRQPKGCEKVKSNVTTHRKNIFCELGINTPHEAITYMLRAGFDKSTMHCNTLKRSQQINASLTSYHGVYCASN